MVFRPSNSGRQSFFSLNSPDRLLLTFFLSFSFFLPFSYNNPFVLLTFLLAQTLFSCLALYLSRHSSTALFSELKHKHRGLYLLFIAWLLICCVSYTNAIIINKASDQQVMQGTIRLIFNFLLVLFIFALAKFRHTFAIKQETLIINLSLGCCFMIGIQLYLAHYGPNVSPENFLSFPLFIGHIRELGFLSLASLCAAYSYFIFSYSPSIYKKLILISIIFITATFTIWAGGRTSAASAIITLVLISLLALLYKRLNMTQISIILAMLIAAYFSADALSIFNWNGLGRTLETIQTASQSVIQENSAAIETTGRNKIWALSIEGIKSAPLIGHGPYGYRFLEGWFYGMQPHNIVLQFLIEWGIIGTLLVLGMMFYIAIIGFKQLPSRIKHYDASYVASLAIIVSLGLNSLTSGAHYNPMPMFYLALAYAYFPFASQTKTT